MSLHQRFIESPPLQPKLEAAMVAESLGYQVPKRYTTLEAAIYSGKSFIIRSEHPQEYNGVSGLLESFSVTPAIIQSARAGKLEHEDEKTQHLLKCLHAFLHQEIDEQTFWKRLAESSKNNIRFYCDLKGIDVDEFTDQVSYSYWDKLEGANLMIAGDDTIEDRIHVYSSVRIDALLGRHYPSMSRIGFCTHERGKLSNYYSRTTPNKKDRLYMDGLAEWYRSLQRSLAPGHRPIIEAQSTETGFHLLQIHAGRDLSPRPNFQLKKSPGPGESEALFARGATKDAQGEICTVPRGKWRFVEGKVYPVYLSPIESEMRSRNAALSMQSTYVGDGYSKLDYLLVQLVNPHTLFTDLFKPRISLVRNPEDQRSLKTNMAEARVQAIQEERSVTYFGKFWVASDGTRAHWRAI